MRIYILLFISLVIVSCNPNACKPSEEVTSIELDISIKRLDRELFNAKEVKSMEALLAENEDVADIFLGRQQFPSDSLLAMQLLRLFNSPGIDTLYQQIQEQYDDLSWLEDEFEMAFKHLQHYYPEAKVPEVYTIMTGLSQDMFVSDSVIIIGLDFFLGEDAYFKPMEVPGYILKRYTPEHIVPSVIMLLSDKYNDSNMSSRTMLADMVYYGKALNFVRHMMPCKDEKFILGYNDEEKTGLEENSDIVWAHFVEEELLYETSHFVKTKYLDERPRTPEVGEKAPGRLGRWLGWQIVKNYQEKQDVSLNALMKEQDEQKILNQAKYRPRSR